MEIRKKEFETVAIDKLTHERLVFISKISGKAQSRILEDFIEAVFAVSVNYRKMSMTIYDDVLEDTIRIVCHGLRSPSALTVGRAHSEQELEKVTFDKINEDLTKKAVGVDV